MQAVRDYAREKLISARDDEELLKMDIIYALFDGIVKEAQKDLAPYEQIKKFTLMHPEFSIQNGELTSTLKLRRKFIYEKYASVIEKMYQTS
jgi:long-chain acyl-CoA synthetase